MLVVLMQAQPPRVSGGSSKQLADNGCLSIAAGCQVVFTLHVVTSRRSLTRPAARVPHQMAGHCSSLSSQMATASHCSAAELSVVKYNQRQPLIELESRDRRMHCTAGRQPTLVRLAQYSY